jgi:hypothetical protein
MIVTGSLYKTQSQPSNFIAVLHAKGISNTVAGILVERFPNCTFTQLFYDE